MAFVLQGGKFAIGIDLDVPIRLVLSVHEVDGVGSVWNSLEMKTGLEGFDDIQYGENSP